MTQYAPPQITRLILMVLVLMLAACADSGGGSTNASSNSASNATATPIPPTATFTPGPVEFTATAFVAAATATGEALARNPNAAQPTEILAAPLDAPLAANCIPGEFNSFDGELSERIQAVLDDADIKDASASVLKVETTQNCVDSTVVRSIFAINVTVGGLTDEAFLIGITENVLQAMTDFPPQSSEGLEPAIFSLRFDHDDDRLTLEGEYALLRNAFNSGLRGKDLIQVVGGLK